MSALSSLVRSEGISAWFAIEESQRDGAMVHKHKIPNLPLYKGHQKSIKMEKDGH